MVFNGTEGEQVTLTEAAEWTANFRQTITPGETIGHFFGKDILNAILNQPNCVGIRTYYGQETDGTKNLVLTGVLENGDDMENGVLAERALACPPHCGKSNLLNS